MEEQTAGGRKKGGDDGGEEGEVEGREREERGDGETQGRKMEGRVGTTKK